MASSIELSGASFAGKSAIMDNLGMRLVSRIQDDFCWLEVSRLINKTYFESTLDNFLLTPRQFIQPVLNRVHIEIPLIAIIQHRLQINSSGIGTSSLIVNPLQRSSFSFQDTATYFAQGFG